MNIFFLDKDPMIFTGKIQNNRFKIKKNKHSNSGARPVINGVIIQENLRTKIRFTMTIHPINLITILIWIGLVFVALLGLLVSIYQGENSPYTVITPIIMILAAWAIVDGGFWLEAKKCEIELRKILE